MRFGIFYEHQLPRPWEEGAERRLISDALEQVELADRLGIDSVWEVEHHFLEEYSHSSASEVFLAAASQRTERIRLGFGIVAIPPGYQHPARVAEKVAMLDLVSGGRVELGTGETSSGAELAGFGVDRATKREQWREALDAIARGIDGAHFFGYSLAHYYVFGDHQPGRTSIWDEFLERRDEAGFSRRVITPDQAPLGIKIMEQGFGSLRGAIGTPEQIRDLVRRYEAAGVDQIIFVSQAGKNRHEHICESLELFAAEVLPEFAPEAEEREAAKRKRLAQAVAAALARRAPAREADPAYVIGPQDSGPPPVR